MSDPYRTRLAPVPPDDAEEALAFWLRVETEALVLSRQASWAARRHASEVARLGENLARRRWRLFALAMLAERGDVVTAETVAVLAPEVPPLRSVLDMAPMAPIQL